jgi:lipopolysaccharide transport protein LptA
LFFVGVKNADAAAKTKPETPTRIRSDIIDIKRKSQIINFINNVVVEKDDSSLLAQKMTVLYDEKAEKSVGEVGEKKSQIRRIDAKENVRIFSEEFIASGDAGFYDPAKNIFVLEKNVIVNNGTSIASGDKFIYDLTTKKSNFVGRKDETSITGNGGDKRVVVVIGDDLQSQKKSKKESKKERDEKNIKR